MFANLSIPRKLGFSFLLICVSAAVMMTVFSINMAMIRSSTAASNHSRAVYADALELETQILRQNSQLRGFLVTGDDLYLKSYYEARDTYDATSRKLETELDDAAQLAQLHKSREETLSWRKKWGDRLIGVVHNGSRVEAADEVRQAGKAVLVSDAVLPLRAIRDAETARIEANSTRQDNAILIATVALVVGGIMLVGLAAVLARMLGRSIARPITALTATMGELASGNNAVAIPDRDRSDELGDMARAVTVFRDAAQARIAAERDRESAMEKIGATLHALAASDLTSRLRDLPVDYAGLAQDFNAAMDQLGQAMAGVRGSVEAINSNSSEIRLATSELAQRSERQASSLQSSAVTMAEITDKIGESARIAADADHAMSEARSEAEQGGAIVAKAIDAMHGIDKASQEITAIIAVIDGIAFQTNLLALNAGVEAARAGDAGKGFAVVASEVRALAQRAAEAASDVKSRIASATEHVNAGAVLVNDTGTALERIIEKVASVSDAIGGIAQSASVQSDALRQVNASIGAMDQLTQQNAAMVEETTAATEMLANEAQNLSRAFAMFKVDTGNIMPISAPRASRPARQPAPSVVKLRPSAGNLAARPADEDWAEF